MATFSGFWNALISTFHSLSLDPSSPVVAHDRFGDVSHFHRLPIHRGGTVDGCSGYQWLQRVKAYLHYRSGLTWLPTTKRFHPEVEYYVLGIRLLNEAWSAERPTRLKKPSASVRTGAAGRRSA